MGLGSGLGSTGGNAGKTVGQVKMFGWTADSGVSFYFVCLVVTVLSTLAVVNLLRSPTGRAFMAIRDSEISAQSMGVNLARYKTLSFALSAAITGVAGAATPRASSSGREPGRGRALRSPRTPIPSP